MTLLIVLVAALVVLFFLILSLEGMQRIYRTLRGADRICRASEDERKAQATLYGRNR